MRRLYFAALSLVVLAACGDSGQLLAPPPAAPGGPLASAFVLTENQEFPISFTTFVPCANGGAGEDVLIEGTSHEVFHITENANGFKVSLHSNPQGVTGTGLTTGDTYRATGSSSFVLHLEPGETNTENDQFVLVGPGPDNNFMVHRLFHITVTPNGDVTAFVDSQTAECR